MAIIRKKPTSPGRRFVVDVSRPALHKGQPFAALVEKKSSSGGRNKRWANYYAPSWRWSCAKVSYY